MRLIDADALKPDYYDEFTTDDDEYVVRYYSEHQIDSAPSMDIVRCKECERRYNDGWIEPRWTCDYLKDMRLKDDDFCSYGVRRKE